MFMFSDVAHKVHEEIAKVIGEDRLPVISDRPSLPYTEAVWKEALRWRPGIPLGMSLKRLIDFDMGDSTYQLNSFSAYNFGGSSVSWLLYSAGNTH
jgi:cytochrome P450